MTPEQEARFRARYEAEQREARFRARYEAEQQNAAPAISRGVPSEVPAARKPTMADAYASMARAARAQGEAGPQMLKDMARPAIETAGGLAGGVIGSALGPAGSVAGGALGYAAAKELIELADVYFGGKAPRQGVQMVTEPVQNLLTGAAFEMGGPIANKLIVQPAINVGGKVAGRFADIFDPKSAVLREAADGKGQEIVSALRASQAQPSLIGAPLTAGQAAVPAGSTRYSALQQSAMEDVPELTTPYYNRMMSQREARLNALRTVGKDEAQLQAAKTARGATASKLYEVAGKQVVDADPELAQLMQTPSMKQAIDRASRLAADRMQDFQIGRFVPEQRVPSREIDVFGRPVGETIVPAEYPAFSVENLHLVKTSLDDMIREPEKFGISATERAATTKIRKNFLKWMENNAGGYKIAREEFARQSKPINQMEVAQFLEGRLVPALSEEAPQRAAAYAQALKEAPSTIKRATTGELRYKQLTDVFDSKQMEILDAIKADLQRDAKFQELAKAARKVGPGALRTVSKTVEEAAGAPSIFPNVLNTVQSLANTITKRLAGKIDKRLAIEIATEMLDPNLAAASMEKALSQGAVRQAILGEVKALGTATTKTAPYAVNALAPTNQNALAQ